jgi:cell wall-associated NlpC family hydrolase
MFTGVRLEVIMTVSRPKSSRPAARLLLALSLVLGLCGGAAATGAAPAQATVSAGVSTYVATRALDYTASKRGAPYQYGAAGPSRFDCSGLTKWAYARAGKTLPRTVAQQYAATIRVSRANARPGDLVFFMSGGRPYHVGVRGSAGHVWHSPKTGDHVKLSTIWTTAVVYGRVR